MQDLEPLQRVVLVLAWAQSGYRVPRCRRRAAQALVDAGLAAWRSEHLLTATERGAELCREKRVA